MHSIPYPVTCVHHPVWAFTRPSKWWQRNNWVGPRILRWNYIIGWSAAPPTHFKWELARPYLLSWVGYFLFLHEHGLSVWSVAYNAVGKHHQSAFIVRITSSQMPAANACPELRSSVAQTCSAKKTAISLPCNKWRRWTAQLTKVVHQKWQCSLISSVFRSLWTRKRAN